MARISKLLDDVVLELATSALKDMGKSGVVARKLQAIIAAKNHGITKTAEFYFITKKTLISWIKEFKFESTEALKIQVGRGRKALLTAAQTEEVRGWINENRNITINRLRAMILDKMQIDLSKSTIHRLMHKLEFSYITPRPRHYKQDPKLKDEFKKKSKD